MVDYRQWYGPLKGNAANSQACALQYSLGTYERSRGNLPGLKVYNMFVEEAPSEDQPILQSRPGLINTTTVMGAGPIKKLFQNDGVLSNVLFGVSNGHLYSGSTNLGAIDGTGPVSMAGLPGYVFACAGSSCWYYDGTTLGTVTMPGGFHVRSICVGTDRLIVIEDGTGHFYWSDVLTDTIESLNFATAENSPDNLLECLFIGDTLYLFGSETVEWWPASSANPNLPYQPLVGKTFQVGIRATGCATEFATTIAWITNHNQICVGDPQKIISDPALDEKLANSTTASLWKFYLDGTAYLACTLDTETYVFSQRSSQWSTFGSEGQTNWIPRCYANGNFGGSVDGHVIQWSTDYQDFGGTLERTFTAGQSILGGTIPIYSIGMKTNPGHTPFITGNYTDPVIELRASRDGGQTWGNWKQRQLGINGEYKHLVRWHGLGFFGNPGILVEIRVTDPVPFRVSGLTANDDMANI